MPQDTGEVRLPASADTGAGAKPGSGRLEAELNIPGTVSDGGNGRQLLRCPPGELPPQARLGDARLQSKPGEEAVRSRTPSDPRRDLSRYGRRALSVPQRGMFDDIRHRPVGGRFSIRCRDAEREHVRKMARDADRS